MHYYFVDHKRSGRALFSNPKDAKEWADGQSLYHHRGQTVKWISGGEHGWEVQRLSDGTTAATVYALLLDEKVKVPGWNDED